MNIEELFQRRIEEINLFTEQYKEIIKFKQKQKQTYQNYINAANRTIYEIENKIDKLIKEKEELEKRIINERGENNG